MRAPNDKDVWGLLVTFNPDEPTAQVGPTAPAGWFPDPSDVSQLRYWDGAQWTAHVAPAVPAAHAGVMPPPAVPARSSKRRLPIWAWLLIGLVGLVPMMLLSPFLVLPSLVVLITAIVALSKNTPTWLRLRSRKAAVAVTAASAVALLVTGSISAAAYPAAMNDVPSAAVTTGTLKEAPAAVKETPAVDAEQKAAVAEFAGETETATDTSVTSGQTALAVLATLEVKGRAPKTGYDRDQFGQRWMDVDHNGCDTRNDTLARDLTHVKRSGRCTVLTGKLADPYTGQSIDFQRGQYTSVLVQIDHVVALSDAWQKGAQQLTDDQRATLANDPLNLLAVDGAANSQKGDGDAATWLPKNKKFRCEYVARQISVKATYNLWVTQAEHDAMARVLDACPDEPALTSAYSAKATIREEAATEPVPFGETTVDDPNLPAGQTRVATAGQNGEKTLTYRVTIVDGEEIKRELVSEEITTPPVGQVIANGTYVAPAPAPAQPNSGCDSNYADACVPIASDVDCAGGSGNGPAYFDGIARVVGSDIYDLDRDHDGYACEPS